MIEWDPADIGNCLAVKLKGIQRLVQPFRAAGRKTIDWKVSQNRDAIAKPVLCRVSQSQMVILGNKLL